MRKKWNFEVLSYNIMLSPGIILLLIFNVIPLFGLAIAFQDYIPAKGILGSKWVGLDHFKYMFQIPDGIRVTSNTVIIAIAKIIVGIVVPVVFALLLHEIRSRTYKRAVQTIVYMPHFLSWVIVGSIFVSMFSMDGVINAGLRMFGIEPVMFMASNDWFRPILILTDTWKEFGYGAIIYLAALTAIDTNLYEAAAIDGANRFRQLIHITLTGLVPTIILVSALSLGNILNAGFDQVYNMYNPLVYPTADIIDTYVYRMGLVDMQFSLGTAVGFMKSVVSIVLIAISYFLANRFAGYKIF
ncbi:sugar ABC transporter permease [Paenibacillus sp. CF384]|uniref:ABC transporter permease n=1 Tax=Paenibacillus sp. CF384 TaxID=1884382 RepID=UPI00089CA8A2|nr:ABC transporter permease subunit [Paenibacillus sp. CF384]SDW71507.1 putative aldouronate transport system permease protein [Paenibacillus sp. CF384]